MRPRNTDGHGAGNAFPQCLLAALLLSLAAAGCENTCVGFASNAGTGTLAIETTDSKSACTLNNANGTVIVQLNAAGASAGAPAVLGLRHIFISLRGIEARADLSADGTPASWQELAPKLARQPVQVDLLARTPSDCASEPFGAASVPAGVYRQVRLRLVPNRPEASEPAPTENACGTAGFNCVVTASGHVTRLSLEETSPELLIASDGIEGGNFFVLPGARADLAIRFSAAPSLLLPAGNALRMVPVLSASLRAPCEPRRQSFQPKPFVLP